MQGVMWREILLFRARQDRFWRDRQRSLEFTYILGTTRFDGRRSPPKSLGHGLAMHEVVSVEPVGQQYGSALMNFPERPNDHHVSAGQRRGRKTREFSSLILRDYPSA